MQPILQSLGGEKHHRSRSWGGVDEVHFDNALSERLLLDQRMEEVWRFLFEALEDIEYSWLKFLAEVQLAAKGPGYSR